MQSCCGGSSLFSGQIRLMQRPELVKTRRSAAAVAVKLLGAERQREEEDERLREKMKKT